MKNVWRLGRKSLVFSFVASLLLLALPLTAQATPIADSISGVVWNDTANPNGVQDSGEPGIPGVIINLMGTLNDGTVTNATTSTTTDGAFDFTTLTPGEYEVTVDPGSPSLSGLTPGQTANAYVYTLAAGDSFPNAIFAYEGTGTDPIPEPSTMLLFGSGLAGLVGWRKWKSKIA